MCRSSRSGTDQAGMDVPVLRVAAHGCIFSSSVTVIPQSPARASSRLNSTPRSMLGAITDVQTFGLAASLLYVKFLATSMMQARKSFAANTRMAEDKQLVCVMGLSGDMDDKQLKIAQDNETRWRRIVQNDLESIPLAFLVFWGAIHNGVDPELTKTLMVVYTTARFGHTIAYGAGAAKSRMACWMSGTACILTAAVNIAMNVFA